MAFKEQIRLLVAQAHPKQIYFREGVGVVDPRAHIGQIGAGTHVAADGTVRLVSEPAALLQKLYSIAGPEDRNQFAGILLALLTEGTPHTHATV